MPIFGEGEGKAPAWSELEAFYLEYIEKGQKKEFEWRGPMERYFVIEGTITGICGDDKYILNTGQVFDPPAGKVFAVSTEGERAGICRCCGSWGGETGGSGLFGVAASDNPANAGDPTDYPRNASFDNHYHDCDEYWIIYRGSGTAYSEGVRYEVKPGDCVATGRGYHHDFPICEKTVGAVYLETTLAGKKRGGHLWEHTHGKPSPDPDRR